MKVLLDENLHAKLGSCLPGHEVLHVTRAGLAGKKNGELLRLSIEQGFEAFVTMDQNLQYQQNLSKLEIKVVLIKAANNRIETLKALAPQILEGLANADKFTIVAEA